MALLIGLGATASVTPIQKVIQMLTDMQANGRKELMAEQVAFAKFQTWCTQKSEFFQGEIAQNSQDINSLTASIAKLDSDIQTLGAGIMQLEGDVATRETQKKAETLQREKDHADFVEESTDFAESVDALNRAIAVLEKQNFDRPAAGAALLQVSEKARIPDKVKSIISAFIGMMDNGDGEKGENDFMAYDAPEANAYEFQSGGIIALLKRLRDEFRSKLSTCQKEEMNSAHAHDLIVNDLQDAIENANRDIESKTKQMNTAKAQVAEDTKTLTSTMAEKEENTKTLADMTAECHEKGLSYEEKQNLRKEELEAIAKAIEILSTPEVQGAAEKYLALAQAPKKARAFVQVMGREESGGFRRHIREFLAKEGRRLHSRQLALLADSIGAMPDTLYGEKTEVDVFGKVKAMIAAMITRLTNEANADAVHEGFCDKELGKSKVTRTRLTEEIDALDAAVEEGKATIMQLAKDIATLSTQVEELTKARQEATAFRKEEKATNALTVKDAKAAQAAIAAAVAVLNEFYSKAMTSTAFLQLQAAPPRKWGLKKSVKMGSEEWNALANKDFKGTVGDNYEAKLDTGHKEGMQTFGEVYHGQQDEDEYGVLALLSVIQSDFVNLESDTVTAEAVAQKMYEDFMAESQKNIAVSSKSIELKTADKLTAETRLRQDIADLKATQDELLTAERYHARLVPQCTDKGMTWDERVKARAEEIASLKEALEILSREDIATTAL